MAMQGRLPSTGSPPSPVDTAFEQAYRAFGTSVLRYALRRSTSREDALDVVAETFAVAWRRRPDLPTEPDEVLPWLFAIARLCSANSDRSSLRAGRLGERLASALGDAMVPDPAVLHEDRTDRHLIRRALEQLPDQDRELVTLIGWDGLTPAQAAGVLGLSAGTARVRLHRARARLRRALHTSATVEEVDRDH
ncbi:RNA polymerase sigma factor [Blastococcus sp. SYSU D00695]